MKDRSQYFKEYYKRPEVVSRMKKWHIEYKNKNKDKLKKKRSDYYQNNKAEIISRRKSYMAEYRIKNSKILKLKRNEYYKVNKLKRQVYNSKYHQLNKDKINKRHVDYFKTEIGKMYKKTYKHNRRSLTKGLTSKIIQQVYEENVKKFGTLTCELCFKPCAFGDDSLEHFIPLSCGGGNERSNLGVAHRICNSKKGVKTFELFITKN